LLAQTDQPAVGGPEALPESRDAVSRPEAAAPAELPVPADRNRLGAGEPLCSRSRERRIFARSLCRRCIASERQALGLTCSYVAPGGEACVRGVESRGFCSTHVRELRASGVLSPLRADGRSGRLPARLAGGQLGNASKSTPLSRWLRRGELKSPAIRRHVQQLGAELAASLGGTDNLSAQQAVALEHVCLARVAVLLALKEMERGAFGPNSSGDRVASAGYQALIRGLAESRQQLAQLGMERKAQPITFDAIVKEAAQQAEQEAARVQDAELVGEPAAETRS
jgi:hypothetical protein